MNLIQQITFLTFPLTVLVATFGGWCLYQLTTKCDRDIDNKLFMQAMVAASLFIILMIGVMSIATFEKLIQLGY